MRVGVFGGTFDPVHKGHLVVAEDLRKKLALSKVIFVPAGEAWHRKEAVVASSEERLEMLKLAIWGYPFFEVSSVDIVRGGPTYSVETLLDLRKIDGEAEFFFLLGSDAFSKIDIWHTPEKLFKMCRVVVFKRPRYHKIPWDRLERKIPGIRKMIRFIKVPQVDISSTQIRRLAAEGLLTDEFVPKRVREYIRRKELY